VFSTTLIFTEHTPLEPAINKYPNGVYRRRVNTQQLRELSVILVHFCWRKLPRVISSDSYPIKLILIRMKESHLNRRVKTISQRIPSSIFEERWRLIPRNAHSSICNTVMQIETCDVSKTGARAGVSPAENSGKRTARKERARNGQEG